MSSAMKLSCGERVLDVDRVLIMGVVNLTPDSFSDGGKFSTAAQAADFAQSLIQDGADIIDIGGVATSPHLKPDEWASEDEELERIMPVLQLLAKRGIRCISIDTSRARVAHQALDAGASWINDQSAGLFDAAMPAAMARADAVVLMHRVGCASGVDAGNKIVYGDVIAELVEFFKERMASLAAVGVAKTKMIVDPGVGFGKGLTDSLTIINNMHRFEEALGAVSLIGLSRKSFLYPMTRIEHPRDRDFASLGAHAAAIVSGTRIIRTHNVRASVDMARVFEQCLKAKTQTGAQP